MSDHDQHKPVTIGVLAGWQFYWTATPLSYLSPVFQGICQAAQTLGCNVLLSCGMGPSATSGDPLRPAWPQLSSAVDAADQTDFVRSLLFFGGDDTAIHEDVKTNSLLITGASKKG